MTTPTIADRLAEVLPDFWCPCCDAECTSVDEDGCCSQCGATPADTREHLRPYVLALIHTLIREERGRCAEIAPHGFNAGWSAEEIATAICALEDRP